MRSVGAVVGVLILAGCFGGVDVPPGEVGAPERTLNALEAPGARVLAEGRNVTFLWDGDLGAGAAPPLVAGSLLSQWDQVAYEVPVDDSVGTLTLSLTAPGAAVARLRTDDGNLACVARSGRVCSAVVGSAGPAAWALEVISLDPEGTTYTVAATLDPDLPAYGTDPTPTGAFAVHDPEQNGGEPTLAVLDDGRLLVVAGSSVLRLEADGSWTDVTPPLETVAGATLDPFLYGDPVTGRVYLSQLVQCMKLSWTDDAGASWVTNPAACGGPEQHHQKITVGAGPAGRVVHIAMMNLASWLTTDEVVVVHSRSFDDGFAWTQNPALVPPVHGMEARAIGNLATSEAGTVHAVAYLCDRFVDAEYNGLGVGRSNDFGATWTWQRIAPGGGACEGIDPGIAAVGDRVHAAWWDASAGDPALWYARSDDDGTSWTEPARIPTPGLGTFVFADAAASADRVVVAFLGTPDTARGANQAHGWAQWYPYLASLDLTVSGAPWEVWRLENDPLQIGPICMDGPMCMDGARNLLDFIDVQLGADGLARVAYADGCYEECSVSWESRGSRLHVAVEQGPDGAE